MMNMVFELSSSLLKALAHPTRLQILDRLRNEDELCVCHIYEDLALEQSNVSQHLKILRDQGLLTSRKEGLNVLYKVKYPEIFHILDMVKNLLLKQIKEAQDLLEKEV